MTANPSVLLMDMQSLLDTVFEDTIISLLVLAAIDFPKSSTKAIAVKHGHNVRRIFGRILRFCRIIPLTESQGLMPENTEKCL